MNVPVSQWPKAAATVFRTFGVRGGTLRAQHELRRVAHRFRAAPRHAVNGRGAPGIMAVDRRVLLASCDREEAMQRAARVVAGEHQAYRHAWSPLPATAAEWLTNPRTGQAAEPGNWWRVRHLGASGDIKDLWEPARFAWAFDLVRGYLLTNDDVFAAAFHRRLAVWCESSPPFKGPHWSCGQETAIRAVALLYAETNLAGAPSSGPSELQRIRDVMAASGERIADGIGYAISQRNNHAISEAVGLILLGVRFKREHPEAESWLNQGIDLLRRLIAEQFAPDGWYIQHSFNYLRLALDQCVLAQRGLRSIGRSLPPDSVARIESAVNLLLAVIEPGSGIVPNHGANDGAFVHPITTAGYRDFRPVLTAVCASFGIALPKNIAVDREVLAWLGLSAPAETEPVSDGVVVGESGWAAVRCGRFFAFLRAGRYQSRPSHLDGLHLDVRIDGREVVVDPGTYAYNAPPPWKNALTGAAVHNGPVLDGEEPGVRGPRFLWFVWPEAHLVSAESHGGGATLVAEIPGRARRTVHVTAHGVEVSDRVLDPDASRIAVRWLLHPAADPRHIRVEGESTRKTGDDGAAMGWFSPMYGHRARTSWIEVERPGQPDTTIYTSIGALDAHPRANGSH